MMSKVGNTSLRRDRFQVFASVDGLELSYFLSQAVANNMQKKLPESDENDGRHHRSKSCDRKVPGHLAEIEAEYLTMTLIMN